MVVEASHHHESSAKTISAVPQHSVGTLTIIAICAIVMVSLMLITAVAYKCYRRRVMQNSQYRLSTAIKKGLKENSSTKKMHSRGSHVMKTSKSTSPITPPEHPSGPGEKLSPGSFTVKPDTMDSPHHLGKTEVHFESEKGGETPEKDEEKRIKEHKDVIEIIDTKQPPKYLGSLNFAVEYDQEKAALLVNIINVTDLPPRDPSLGGCDPYVKLQLLPEKKHKCKTRVMRKTLNPVYDETFTFYGIQVNQLQGIILHFVLLSFDRYSRDAIIGEVLYPIDVDVLGAQSQRLSLCKEVTPRHLKFRSQGCGEILVSLCYQPAANRLTVVVLKARNLPKMDLSGLSDPYVKIYLLYNGQRIAKKKTHVKKRTLNPVFNESFLFDVPYNEGLQNISLEFLVLDWDRMTKNEVVGRLEIGTRSRGAEHHHWNEVMKCPRKQIAEWHKLSEQ